MKLSEAIRLGAMVRPQAYHSFLRDGRSCALGSALEATGFPLVDGLWMKGDCAAAAESLRVFMDARWPFALRLGLQCPACSEAHHRSAAVIIGHLNDSHRWTRERIAEWVATIEPQEPLGVRHDARGRESLPAVLAPVTESR